MIYSFYSILLKGSSYGTKFDLDNLNNGDSYVHAYWQCSVCKKSDNIAFHTNKLKVPSVATGDTYLKSFLGKVLTTVRDKVVSSTSGNAVGLVWVSEVNSTQCTILAEVDDNMDLPACCCSHYLLRTPSVRGNSCSSAFCSSCLTPVVVDASCWLEADKRRQEYHK